MTIIKKFLIFFLGPLLFLSCRDSQVKKSVYTNNYEKRPIIENNFISQERHYIVWLPKRMSKNQPLGFTFFEDIATSNLDHNFLFELKMTSNRTFNLYWPQESLASKKVSFLNQSNGCKDFPRKGDCFATYTVVNDSLIEVEYEFPEWSAKINSIVKDSVFPKYLYYFE